MSSKITVQVFAANRNARHIVARALRELDANKVGYVTRRAQMDAGLDRYEATPFYLVDVNTRYEARAIKMRIDAIAAEVSDDSARDLGATVRGIPAQSPA